MKKQIELISIDDKQREIAEEEIREKHKITDYDIREYPIEVIVSKFTTGIEEDKSELYIPDYQRELVWSSLQQSRFIESIMLNLPVPYIFVADTPSGLKEGRLEIIDGSQRIRTLVNFLQDNLCLHGLELLPRLNGFRFSDLAKPRQLRFLRKTVRMIELTERADEEARRLMFDRLNSGGTKLVGMEQRMGAQDGPFMLFIREMAQEPEFRRLCPISPVREKRREYEELILRFYAYLDRYQSFEKRVDLFLTDYLKQMNLTEFRKEEMRREFCGVLEFVNANFPNGFKKSATHESVPRIRFEAISVGSALALRENENLIPPPVSNWIDSKEFRHLTRSDASNSRPRLIDRIHFVRDSLLEREVEWSDPAKDDEDRYASPDLFQGM